ncbi:MAG: TetR/AcrR family transcriptional regulator [Desulfobacterales bacterium]
MGIAERKKREKKILEEMRRKQIQEAAMTVFLDKDFDSATVEEIADRCELSPATLYLYFKNKQELYASLHLMYLEDLHDAIEDVYKNASLSVEEKIMELKNAMYKTFQCNPVLLKIIFHVQLYNVLPNLDKKLLDELNRIARSFMKMMAAIYEEGVSLGKFKTGHSMMHADILWATFSGLVVWEEAKRQIAPTKDFLKATLDRAFDIFFWGIKKDAEN